MFSYLLQRHNTNHFGNCKPTVMFSSEMGLFAELGMSLQA